MGELPEKIFFIGISLILFLALYPQLIEIENIFLKEAGLSHTNYTLLKHLLNLSGYMAIISLIIKSWKKS